MRRFLVEVSQIAFDRLAEQARRERRPLKDQAAWLIERAVLRPVPAVRRAAGAAVETNRAAL